MVFAGSVRPLRRRVIAVAVAALMAFCLSPGAWQTAVADDGRPVGIVLAWGFNNFGQLGDGTNTDRSTPVPVCASGQTAPCNPFLHDVVAVSAAGSGGHSLALREDGTVLAWGLNNFGQLGDGTTTNRNTPVPVCAPGQTAPCTRFLTGVVAISAGGTFSLALREDGTVLAWGMNEQGQLGDGTADDRDTPVPVCAPGQTAPCTRFLTGVHAISAGTFHSLALRKRGTVLAWGGNFFGQLGDGTNTVRRIPVPVCAPGQTAPCSRFLTGVHAISAGNLHSLALRKHGTVLAWGLNNSGQLGDGTTTDRSTPVPVCAPGQTAPCTRFVTGVHAISAGGLHSLALRKRGTVLAWGLNNSGQLGDGTTTNRNTPVRVCAPGQAHPCTRFLTHAHAISAGSNQSLALRKRGTALAWGGNAHGQLGDGTTTNRNTPVRVCAPGQAHPCTRFLAHANSISAGGDFSLALADHHESRHPNDLGLWRVDIHR
ncbi:hypothetical protein ABZ746_16620 [Streptomyces sp. NPDC020096]